MHDELASAGIFLKRPVLRGRAEAAEAVAYAARVLKITAEPGGAVALAAALTGKLSLQGKVAAVIVSGGNIDPSLHARIVAAGGLPH